MAVRRLERTIIEGGRANWVKFARNSYNRRERHAVSQDLRSFDIDNFDGWAPAIRRSVMWDGLNQYDRLAPMERYIHKFRGKPYNDLISSLLKKMDRRNIKAYHLISHVESYLGTYAKRYMPSPRFTTHREEDVEDGVITFAYRDSWKRK